MLDDLDLTLEPGTTTWVGGRNGVGKTTMLRVAAGLIEPDSGRAEVWGVAPGENRVRYQQLVSFLPAGDRGLYARLTVRRQLEFWARIAMVPRDRFRATIEHAIETFDLEELAERRVDRMSMGQRQRLRIAMTFLPEPEVVLLDEPLTSLDSEGDRPDRGRRRRGARARRRRALVLPQRREPRHELRRALDARARKVGGLREQQRSPPGTRSRR